ncbi:S41 family peptidase [Sphingomonas sp.]|jgi:hypothetical protein|uniref:S41 family peptidase n=1 Tax=Sphingomonas sp. TaxID=28214 RepID=UPI002DEE2557|nr:S41 family peptidase [Sphingomonas sp.]
MKFPSWPVVVLAAISAGSAPARPIDAAERRAIITGAAQLIEDRYVYADRGQEFAKQLRAAAARDIFRSATDTEAFAQAFTDHLMVLSKDGHFSVDYREEPEASTDSAGADFVAAELEKWYGRGVNHGFEAVRRLDGNVGYLDLTVFAPLRMAADLATGAMTMLAQSDALIVDLRNNGGGMSEMVLFLSAYLLDGPIEMSAEYERPTRKMLRFTSPAWVPGRHFSSSKPVYVLTSRKTFSAAEAFAYDLQALGRVTVVGETSGGGAHPFEYRPISNQFFLSLPERRSINPITCTDWQGKGVKPDVEVPADRALEEALALARKAAPKPFRPAAFRTCPPV